MKKLLLVLSVSLFTTASGAFQDKDININLGGGFFGTRGLLGLSIDRFYDEHQALSSGVGLDFIGATSTAGYKYFTDKKNTSNTLWDESANIFIEDELPFLFKPMFNSKTFLKSALLE